MTLDDLLDSDPEFRYLCQTDSIVRTAIDCHRYQKAPLATALVAAIKVQASQLAFFRDAELRRLQSTGRSFYGLA